MYAQHPSQHAPMRFRAAQPNPLSRGQKVAIGVGVVALVGVGAFLLWPRTASASELPPPPGGGGSGGGGGGGTGGGGGGGGSSKVPAPSYPPQGLTLAQAFDAENGIINAVMAQHCDAGTGLCTKTIAEMRQQVWNDLYGVQIPSAGSQGTGWGPWLTARSRIEATIQDMLPYGQTVYSGGQKVPAPKWPPAGLTSAQAKQIELAESTNAVISNCDYVSKQCSKTIEEMASIAWNAIPGYKGVVIPSESKAKGGWTGEWKPWLDAWKRIVNNTMKQADAI